MATFADEFWALADQLSPIVIELSFFVFFGLGFLFLRLDKCIKEGKKVKKKIVDESEPRCSDAATRKAIEAEAACGNHRGVLTIWQKVAAQWPTPPYLLRTVMQALYEVSPDTMADEILRHMSAHSEVLSNTRTAGLVLEVIARLGDMERTTRLWEEMHGKLDIPQGMPVYEVFLGGFAAAGAHDKVKDILLEIKENHLIPSARSYCVVIKGFLKHGRIDDCLEKLLDMHAHVPQVPAFALCQLFRIAADAGRMEEVLEKAVEGNLEISGETVAVVLEDCQRQSNVELTQRVESLLRRSKDGLHQTAFEGLIKIFAGQGNQHAIHLFKEMQSCNLLISEGFSHSVLTRCAEAKFIKLAEELLAHWRSKGAMSVQLYSSLMKVYAFNGMYDKACDLYPQLLSEGLQPDGIMYSCLMKFAAECGRTSLSQEMSEKLPNLDVQNFMSLMRSAVHDRDAPRAMALLRRWQASEVRVDVAAWNCCLDACVSAGDVQSGRALLDEMVKSVPADIITYNTLLKGYFQVGDIAGAKTLICEMESAGHRPNDVTYNCMVNAAVTYGSFDDAWQVLESMKDKNVPLDHYTISILLKSLKTSGTPRNVSRALGLIESSSVGVFSDEIMLNTVLETCIRYQETSRLEKILSSFATSGLRPGIHTFASLIQAAGFLKWIDQCWKLWTEMEEQGLQPNEIVLGCMLNSLVSAGRIDEAVKLFRKTKGKIQPNTVLYSTLIKGFANSHRSSEAMETLREMRQEGVKINVVVYNAVIDAHARMGLMKEVSELVEAMEPDGCRPDHITYSTIVKGYCVTGELEKAIALFNSMQKHLPSLSVIFNTILDGCVRQNRNDLADNLLAQMEDLNIIPSTFTLSTLIKMYGRRKQLDNAFCSMDVLTKKYDLKCGPQVWTCLMCVCINNDALERAFKVFDQIRALPGGADGKAFGAIIQGCIRHGNLDAAIKLVEEAYGLCDISKPWQKHQASEGITAEIMLQLLRALMQKNLMESKGVALLNKLEDKKPQLCASIRNTLANDRPSRNNEVNGPRPRRR